MKTTVTTLKMLLGKQLTKLARESVGRERAVAGGYADDEDGAGVNYGDLPENIEVAAEDADRMRRHMDAWGDDMEEKAGDVPMALRVRLHPKPDAQDMGMGPPVDMVDLDLDGEDEDETDEGYGEACMDMGEATPPGFEKVVKALKKEPDVDNPWAVAQSMKNKGDEPKKESRMPSLRSVLMPKSKSK